MVIGVTPNDKKVFLKTNGNNEHVVACGCSGSGKTTAMVNLVLTRAKHGRKVILFNYKECYRGLPEETKRLYDRMTKKIDIGKEGLPFRVFEPFNDMEEPERVMERIVAVLSSAARLSPMQKDKLRQAIEYVVESGITDSQEAMTEVKRFLEKLEDSNSRIVLDKMRPLFKEKSFGQADMLSGDAESNILELDLNSIEESEQTVLIRFALYWIYRLALQGEFLGEGLDVYVEEVHNLDFSSDSPLIQLINEGRKHGISLLLVTPSIEGSRKKNIELVTQFSTQLYFRPLTSDAKRMAEYIEKNKADKRQYQLLNLKQGECVAVGKFEVEGIAKEIIRLQVEAPLKDDGLIPILATNSCIKGTSKLIMEGGKKDEHS